jgi:hexosaminidase
MKTLMGLAGLTMAGFMLLSCNTEVKEANYQIIPLPQEISVMDQAAPFILSNGTKIMYPEGNEKMQKNAEFLASYIKDLTGKSLAVQAGTDGKGIILQLGGNAENLPASRFQNCPKSKRQKIAIRQKSSYNTI